MTEIWLRGDATEPVEILSVLSSDLNLRAASSRIEMEGAVRMHRPGDPLAKDVLDLYPEVKIAGFRGEISLVRSDRCEDVRSFESSDRDSTVLRAVGY